VRLPRFARYGTTIFALRLIFAFTSTAFDHFFRPARTENDFGIGVQGIGHFRDITDGRGNAAAFHLRNISLFSISTYPPVFFCVSLPRMRSSIKARSVAEFRIQFTPRFF